jgi:hypothetical protein
MAEEKRLIGNDGSLVNVAWGSTVTTPIPAGTWVKIVAKAAAASVFGGLAVGDAFFNPKATTLTVTSGDSYQAGTLTPFLDINGWNLKLTAAEVDVTVLGDAARKYRKGKSDAEGSISFVWIKGITDAAGGLANKFLAIANIDAAGVVIFSAKSTTSLYLLGYLDATAVAGEVQEVTMLQVEVFDVALNVKDNEANNQDVKFRLTGASNPVLYRIINA